MAIFHLTFFVFLFCFVFLYFTTVYGLKRYVTRKGKKGEKQKKQKTKQNQKPKTF